MSLAVVRNVLNSCRAADCQASRLACSRHSTPFFIGRKQTRLAVRSALNTLQSAFDTPQALVGCLVASAEAGRGEASNTKL